MKIFCFLIAVIFSLSGCSLLYSYSDDLPDRINQWIKEKHYKSALNTIEYIKPTHKDYKTIQRQKKSILKLVTSYEQEGINKSTQLAEEGNWILALNFLDEVADNIPDDKNLEKHRDRLLIKRDKIVAVYEYQLLSTQAKNLLEKFDIYEKIRKTLPKNERKRFKLAEYDRMRDETSLKLAKRSEQQYKNSNYRSAIETINLALKLNPDKNIVSRLNKIKKLVGKEERRKTQSYVTEAKSLLKKLQQGYSHAILKETKEKIAWLKSSQKSDNKHKRLISKLEKHLRAGVTQYFEAGRNLYSKGKIEEALSIWLEISPLAPNHPKLQSHIKRAGKVLKKLKKLSNKPANKK